MPSVSYECLLIGYTFPPSATSPDGIGSPVVLVMAPWRSAPRGENSYSSKSSAKVPSMGSATYIGMMPRLFELSPLLHRLAGLSKTSIAAAVVRGNFVLFSSSSVHIFRCLRRDAWILWPDCQAGLEISFPGPGWPRNFDVYVVDLNARRRMR